VWADPGGRAAVRSGDGNSAGTQESPVQRDQGNAADQRLAAFSAQVRKVFGASRLDGLIPPGKLEARSDSATDSRFSRAPSAGGLAAAQDTLRSAVPEYMRTWIQDRTQTPCKFNRWWHRTVGTQFHKAQINKEFGRASYAVPDFMKDVFRTAIGASEQAPDMLQQIDNLSDLAKIVPALVNPKAMKRRSADMKAASDSLFEATLRYTRNEEGEAAWSSLTAAKPAASSGPWPS